MLRTLEVVMPELLSGVMPSVIATVIAVGIALGALGALGGRQLAPAPVKNDRRRR